MQFRIFHRAVTASTNLDARAGAVGDVFTADEQTVGRGRLDHRWLSPPGANLLMSVVLDVAGLAPDRVATLPLAAGLAVHAAVVGFLVGADVPRATVKWPNDVWVGGGKVAGILCERQDDRVIVGVGVNVRQTRFAPKIAAQATSLACVCSSVPTVAAVRDAVLAELEKVYAVWRKDGFAALRERFSAVDELRGRSVVVRQTDDDASPVEGVCAGVQDDGTLLVGNVRVYAGEAHVEKVGMVEKLRS